jgi:hypothetical protein
MCINLSSIKRCEEWKINKKKIKYNIRKYKMK